MEDLKDKNTDKSIERIKELQSKKESYQVLKKMGGFDVAIGKSTKVRRKSKSNGQAE